MNNQKLFGSLVLILSIFAFSGLNMNAQPIQKNRDLDIVFIGNSITQGGQSKNRQEEAPPATASEYLRRKPGVGSVEFSNQGKSGYTTVDFLPSPEGALVKVIAAARQLHKDSQRLLVFSVSLGTNDSAEKGPNGSPVSPGDYQKNLKSIADQLLADFPECKIILQQPIWYSPNTYNRSRYMAEGLARLKTYFPELRSLVKRYSKTNPGHVFMGDRKGFAYFSKNYLTDLNPESGNAGTFYLHPNKKGATVLGSLWGEAIYQRLIKD
jgi:lysophospholipase L1-like esterase